MAQFNLIQLYRITVFVARSLDTLHSVQQQRLQVAMNASTLMNLCSLEKAMKSRRILKNNKNMFDRSKAK